MNELMRDIGGEAENRTLTSLRATTGAQRLILAGIVATGLALRLWGLSWGLPERTDLHPDEHDFVIRHALSVSWEHPDPGFINYPSFLCYSTALLHGALKWVDPGRPDWKAYQSGRLIVALFGTLTILVVFGLARRLGGNATSALLAAGWMAILPLHVWDSHVAVTDVVMTFWIMLALLASLRLHAGPSLRAAALAGVCVGLATGSKYTAAISCLAPLVAVVLARASARQKLALLAVAAACALAACFVVTPFSFIRIGDTLKAMAYENAHIHGHHLGFSVPADGPQYHRFLYQLVAAWPFSLGAPLYLAALAGAVWFCVRPSRPSWVILAFAGAFLLLTCTMTFTPLRYYMPLLVLGTLFAGLWLGGALAAPGAAWRRRVALAAVLAVSAYTAAFTVSTTWRYPHDTRIAAGQWITAQLEQGRTVHVFGWNRYSGFPNSSSPNLRVHVEAVLGKVDTIAANELIEITSLHFLRWQRHNSRNYRHVYNHLRSNPDLFELVASFDTPFLNRDLYGRLDPMFRSYFVSPTLEFYRRKPPAEGQAKAGDEGSGG